MKPEQTDVVIVGAGTTGLAAAWELAKAGVDVIAVDKGNLAGEGAGKSGSNIRMVGRHDNDVPLMLESIKLWNSMADDLGMDVDLNFCGNLWVSFSDEEQADHLKLMERDLAWGIEEFAMDRQQLREFAPALTHDMTGAVFSPSSGISNPFKVSFAYWKAAMREGAKFRFGTEVIDFLSRDGRIAGVQTSKGTIEAEVVILAAGPWSAYLASKTGLDLPVSNCPYQKLITEATLPTLPSFVLTSSGSFHQADTGQIHMGHAVHTPNRGFSNAPDADEIRRTVRRMLRVVPCLSRINALRSWVGFLDMTPDDNFIFGDVPELPGLVLACGFSGHGYALSPIVGRLLREHVTDKATSLPMDKFRLERFRNGQVAMDESHFSPRG